MISANNNLNGKITAEQSLSGKLNNKEIYIYSELEELTVTPSAEEQTFKSEKDGYSSVTVKGDENLIPNNILKDKEIFGVIGELETIDTSDATATAEDIAKDKTAYVNGQKLVGTLQVGGNNLSSEYQRVQYLQSNGTQYINTGVCPSAGVHSALVNFILTKKVKSREQWAFGQYSNAGWRCGGATSATGSFSLDTKNGFSYSDIGYNYKTIGMSSRCGITTDYPMLLFAQQESGNAGYVDASYFKIYECKIWENATLIRDFVPCYRISDGEAGMYDIVNNVFYTNDGTGSFIVGPEL